MYEKETLTDTVYDLSRVSIRGLSVKVNKPRIPRRNKPLARFYVPCSETLTV